MKGSLVFVQVCGISLLLPPKKLIGNMDRDFVAERQRGLQAYLDSLTQHPLLCSSLPVKKFLDPSSYSANYTGVFAPRGSVKYSPVQERHSRFFADGTENEVTPVDPSGRSCFLLTQGK